MRPDAAVLRGKTERQGDFKFFERPHLPVEPGKRSGPEAVRPAQSRPEMPHAERAHDPDGGFEAGILEVRPLTDAQVGRMPREPSAGRFRRSVLSQQAHVKMAEYEDPSDSGAGSKRAHALGDRRVYQ